jgi:hypothetical protein
MKLDIISRDANSSITPVEFVLSLDQTIAEYRVRQVVISTWFLGAGIPAWAGDCGTVLDDNRAALMSLDVAVFDPKVKRVVRDVYRHAPFCPTMVKLLIDCSKLWICLPSTSSLRLYIQANWRIGLMPPTVVVGQNICYPFHEIEG